jgi:hypothetical protein
VGGGGLGNSSPAAADREVTAWMTPAGVLPVISITSGNYYGHAKCA